MLAELAYHKNIWYYFLTVIRGNPLLTGDFGNHLNAININLCTATSDQNMIYTKFMLGSENIETWVISGMIKRNLFSKHQSLK